MASERILALLTPGAVVGDLSMIDGLPRSASVFAVSNCGSRSQLFLDACAGIGAANDEQKQQ